MFTAGGALLYVNILLYQMKYSMVFSAVSRVFCSKVNYVFVLLQKNTGYPKARLQIGLSGAGSYCI